MLVCFQLLGRTRHARLGLLDRCPLGVDELPLPVLPDEDAGPAALLIDRSILVFSLGSGAITHDAGISIDADFDLIRDQRVEIHAPVLRSSRYCARVSTFPCGRKWS